MAATVDYQLEYTGYIKIVSIPLSASVTVFKGTLVGIVLSTGYGEMMADATTHQFFGIALEKVTNGATAGAKSVQCAVAGVFKLPFTSAVITGNGKTVGVSAAEPNFRCGTITAATCKTVVGIQVGYVSATQVWVNIGQRVGTTS